MVALERSDCRRENNCPDRNADRKEREVTKPDPEKEHSDKEVEAIEEELEFDPNGPGEYAAGLVGFLVSHPFAARSAREEAIETANDEFRANDGHNDQKDAFRHALASYLLTKDVSGRVAKLWGDAHERTNPNPAGERVMDLYNNRMGRVLAQDPKNATKKPAQVIRNALNEGKLMTGPVRVQSGEKSGARKYP